MQIYFRLLRIFEVAVFLRPLHPSGAVLQQGSDILLLVM